MAEEVRITPKSKGRGYWRLCWDFRELLLFTARRDFVVKYRQTLAGILWLLAKPITQIALATIVFGHMAEMPSDGLPYPMMVASGVVVWAFFAAIVSQSTQSLVGNKNLVTRVFFPRLLLPIATVFPNLIDLAITLLVYLLVMGYYQWFHPYFYELFTGQAVEGGLTSYFPSWRIVLLPVPLLLIATFAVGLGFFFSAGSVRYRDFRQLQPFAMNVFLWLSPIYYTSTLAKEKFNEFWLQVYYCNPLAVCVDLTRWCLVPEGYVVEQHAGQIVASICSGLAMVFVGQWFFRRLERTFADVI